MSKVYSLLAGREIDAPAPRAPEPPPLLAQPEDHPLEGVLKRVVDRNLAQMVEEERTRAEAAHRAVEEERTAKAAAEARAAAHEAQMAQERQAAAEEQRRYQEAQAAMEAQRLDWERQALAAREQHQVVAAELERTKVELETVRRAKPIAAPAPAPAPLADPQPMKMDVRMNGGGQLARLILRGPAQTIDVEVRRDAAGQLRQLVLKPANKN